MPDENISIEQQEEQNGYTPENIVLLNTTKSNIETAASTIADNSAINGQSLLATGNGDSEWGDLDPDNIKLTSDLYTYTPIGKITGASNTNPKKVASQGESLTNVFTAILGEQQDQDPTITKTINFGFTQTANYDQSDIEIGSSIPSKNISFTLNSIQHEGIASYGLNYGDNLSTYSKSANTHFIYPLNVKQIEGLEYNFIIKARNESDYALISTATASTGEIVYIDNMTNSLYCKFYYVI